MKIKAIRAEYSGDSTEATRKEASRARNKSFVCSFFGVKSSTPENVLKEAIKRHTGKKMSFSAFRYQQQKQIS